MVFQKNRNIICLRMLSNGVMAIVDSCILYKQRKRRTGFNRSHLMLLSVLNMTIIINYGNLSMTILDP